jgi:hypothetical protein
MRLESAKLALEKVLQRFSAPRNCEPYTELSFEHIDALAHSFADHIESVKDRLVNILLTYESYEVAEDELDRTLDVLRNLHENREYFQFRVNNIASFLPRNQPLYALTCFVIVPSLMSSEVHFRIPHGMKHFLPQLLEVLMIGEYFPNVKVSEKQRLEFLREQSALRVDPATKYSVPVTDAAIFTGTSVHAEQLRSVFDKRTLFITNGAGHNPVVVGPDADVAEAAEAVMTLQLYNQGQDCAAPNAILVHAKVYGPMLDTLRAEIKKVRVGPYSDKENRVGPISDPVDLVRIEELLIRNRAWLDETTPGVIHSREAIVEPTIVCKPLREGGNFSEVFSPIVFLQRYDKDADLAQYFENEHYARNAMYISVYGTSAYVDSLISKQPGGKMLHDEESVLHNKHLHEKGVERGIKPYGGLGYGASSVSIHGKTTPKATLPQRDIYEHIVLPLLQAGLLDEHRKKMEGCTQVEEKNVEKILRLHTQAADNEQRPASSTMYIDVRAFNAASGSVYLELTDEYAYALLNHPNVEYISTLTPSDLKAIRELRDLLLQPRTPEYAADFETNLYAIANGSRTKKDRARQLQFFQHVYELLLGKKSGPRLTQFLLDIDSKKATALLDV